MAHLLNKKILLFVPQGEGIYGKGIIQELERRGAFVRVYNERPSTSTLSKVALRLFKNKLEHYLKGYYYNIIQQTKTISFDYVFVIRGEGLTPIIAKMLRRTFPKAYFILYLWDSLKNNNIKSIFPFFDRLFSFDKYDVNTNTELAHRALFFLPEYRQIANLKTRSIDVLFIGTIHSDRFSFIKNLEFLFKQSNLSTYFYFYFPSRLLFIKKKFLDSSFKKTRMKNFNYKMIPAKQAAYLLSQAKVSLDIEGPGQHGLTMRTIEVLGAQRKLITTNKRILEYDFYNKQNILLVDREKPELDVSFINSPFEPTDKETYEKYSIEGWIEEIFN